VGAPITVHSTIDSVIELQPSAVPEPGGLLLILLGVGAALSRPRMPRLKN
jgi:hypothetical protein